MPFIKGLAFETEEGTREVRIPEEVWRRVQSCENYKLNDWSPVDRVRRLWVILDTRDGEDRVNLHYFDRL